MASVLSHPAVPIALAAAAGWRLVPRRLLAAAVVCSILPDFDAIGLWAGIPYASTFGHRGFTHSILFAVITATVGWMIAPHLQAKRWVAWLVLFLSTFSHGVLDAMTTGGLGVAFFSPFSNHRFFLPWRVIEVSPIGVSRFFSMRGIEILGSEIVTVWLPCALFAATGILVRKLSRTKVLGHQPQKHEE